MFSFIFWLGGVCSVFLWHIQLLTLVTPLSRGNWRKVRLPGQTGDAKFLATFAEFRGHVRLDLTELVQRGLLNVDAVSGHPDGLFGLESAWSGG